MSIAGAAKKVAGWLARRNCKVVFAESCTGGLVSGALTAVPGVSRFHCGGVVVYRNETKGAYLDISTRLLNSAGPVSAAVARQMAERVLVKTPEAKVGLSVTGHLGPAAPELLDGRVFIGVAVRGAAASGRLPRQSTMRPRVNCEVHELNCRGLKGRLARQRWVVERALLLLAERLETGCE